MTQPTHPIVEKTPVLPGLNDNFIPITEFPPYPGSGLVKYLATVGTSMISLSLSYLLFFEAPGCRQILASISIMIIGASLLAFSLIKWKEEEELKLANYVWHVIRLISAQKGSSYHSPKAVLQSLYSTRKQIQDEIDGVRKWAK